MPASVNCTEYGLRFKRGDGTICEACVVASGSGNGALGGIPKLRKGGVTFDIYCVTTADAFASPWRAEINVTTRAIRYRTTYVDYTDHDDYNDHDNVIIYDDAGPPYIDVYDDHLDYTDHDDNTDTESVWTD